MWIEKFNLKEFIDETTLCGVVHYALYGGCCNDDADKIESMMYELYTDYDRELSIGYYLADIVTRTHYYAHYYDGYIAPNCTSFHLFPKVKQRKDNDEF